MSKIRVELKIISKVERNLTLELLQKILSDVYWIEGFEFTTLGDEIK